MLYNREQAELQRLSHFKGPKPVEGAFLGPEVVQFFKKSVEKRQDKLGRISECWSKLVPALLAEHSALESFSRGTLTVIVDSSSHLYELRQLLLAGLEQQLLLACKSAGLKKISLKQGRWYAETDTGDRRVKF